jgi:hypothetical protein
VDDDLLSPPGEPDVAVAVDSHQVAGAAFANPVSIGLARHTTDPEVPEWLRPETSSLRLDA